MSKSSSQKEVWAKMADHWSKEDVQAQIEESQFFKSYTIAMEKWFPLESGMIVLEPGSGTGSLSVFVAQRWDVRVMCLDFISDSLEIARRKFLDMGVTGDFIQADIRYMPFKENTIDLVFNEGVIEHFRMPERQNVVDEMSRVSSKFVAIFVPNSLNPFRAVAKRVQIIQKRWSFGLEIPYSPWELKHRLEKTGMKVVKKAGVNFYKIFYTYWPIRLFLPQILVKLLGDKLYQINASESFLNRIFGDEIYMLATKDSANDTTKHRERA